MSTASDQLLDTLASELVDQFTDEDSLIEEVRGRWGWPPPWKVTQALSKAGHLFIGPQPGFQTKALECSADVAIYDGDAGSGKSWVMLLEVLNYIQTVPGFNAVIFRETRTDIIKQEGLWDKSQRLYAGRGRSRGSLQYLDWEFYPFANRLQFAQLHTEDAKYEWQGSEIAYIGFDEITHFSESQFVYLLTRNRTMCGVRPFVRATCNPNRQSWVFNWVRPWVDPNHELYGTVGDGEHLHFRRLSEEEEHPPDLDPDQWKDLLIKRDGEMCWVKPETPMCTSLTAIYGPLEDNAALLEADPDYPAKLYGQDRVTRRRLTSRDWMIRLSGGSLFKDAKWQMISRHEIPPMQRKVRTWDCAATEEQAPGSGRKPDFTAAAGVGVSFSGEIVIYDLQELRGSYAKVVGAMSDTAITDGRNTKIVIEQERIGSQGKLFIGSLKANELRGYDVIGVLPMTGKEERAKELSKWLEQGKVKLVRQPLAKRLKELCDGFPEVMYDDLLDAVCWAVLYLVQSPILNAPKRQSPSVGQPRLQKKSKQSRHKRRR